MKNSYKKKFLDATNPHDATLLRITNKKFSQVPYKRNQQKIRREIQSTAVD